MVNIDNYLGSIELSYSYLSDLVRYVSSGCFGVAALNPDDKLHSFFRFLKNGAYNDNGTAIAVRNGQIYIGLHITVLYGTNISAVSENLAHKVKYAIEDKTGLKVGKITVFIDGIKT
ncbi:MAG: Asp23/Gls24 family envelope stress response protein [Oscillospiraceae bacterium]|nr:Asp23/Gls24 family envelope stress response protein [Oscillospiraceae bacterium]